MSDEIGQDVTAVLPPDDDFDPNEITAVLDDEPTLDLTEEVRGFEPMTETQKEQLFYSCLRGYGWEG